MNSTRTSGQITALLLDLPEPLPWERITWTLAPDGSGAPADTILAWSGDGTRAVIVRDGDAPFAAGGWTVELVLALDVGAERPIWRRGGSSALETAAIGLSLGPDAV